MRTAALATEEAAGAGDGDGELARPRRGKSGHTGWTANQIPSRVGWFLTVRSGLDDPDTLEGKYTKTKILRKAPAELFFFA